MSEGLVKRKNAGMGGGGGGMVDISPAQNEMDFRANKEDDMDDLDSKETRLTLMEEVLLLGLKDKEVFSSTFSQ